MQTVRKKTRTSGRSRLALWLIAAIILLSVIIAAASVLQPQPTVEYAAPLDQSIVLYEYSYPELVSVTIRRGDEAPWTAIPHISEAFGEESVTIQGEDGFTLTWEESMEFLVSAVCITAEEVLTDNPAEYAGHLADYGLENPRYEARIRYADGTDITLRVGDKGPDGDWRYMLISGDDRLFAFSNGSVEGLFVNRDTLRKVSQPDLHKARIDRITLTQGDRVSQWTLDGHITDADAADKWRITAPFTYPADAAAMEQLLTSAANLRLSAYVAPATEDNLRRYGFDAPRLAIELHQDAGTIAVNSADGAAQAVDFPESTVTFVIGGEKTDLVDYVRCGDGIFLSSHFSVGLFLDYDVESTMSRYPVLTALGNLAALSIREGETVTEYILRRTEKVAANNQLITDEDGNPVCDVTVTRNGEPIDYAAFEAAYNALALVSVSGRLPSPAGLPAPHTECTFTDVDGTVHTVSLATFDVLHDAVIVDGHAAFYLIKGGFQLSID